MKFTSILNSGQELSLKQAILQGVASDGGLFVPVKIPKFTELDIFSISQGNIKNTIKVVVNRLFAEDPDKHEIEHALTEAFTHDMPVKDVASFAVLELFHGDTYSFQDISTKFLSKIIIADSKKSHKSATLISATTGDTGASIAHAYANIAHINSVILYGSKSASELQKLQMSTAGKNIYPIEIPGSYDDCYNLVLQVLEDKELASLNLRTTNAKNIGRLIPNIVIFAHFACKYMHKNVRFVLPSGEFSNAYACAVSKFAGLPLGKIIVATNNNSNVQKYYESGKYPNSKSTNSLSYDLDIANPSNFPRILHLLNNDFKTFCEYFEVHTVTDSKTFTTMQHVYQNYKYLLDPQAALAWAVADGVHFNTNDLCVLVSISSPIKFSESITKYVGTDVKEAQTLIKKLRAEENQSFKLPKDFETLKEFMLNL